MYILLYIKIISHIKLRHFPDNQFSKAVIQVFRKDFFKHLCPGAFVIPRSAYETASKLRI